VERGRLLALGAVGLAVMLLTAALVIRLAGSGDTRLSAAARPTTTATTGGSQPEEQQPGEGIEPGDPPSSVDDPLLAGLPVTLPTVSVATIPLPAFTLSQTTAVTRPTTGSTAPGPAFNARGVWVVKTDGSSPILVAGDASAGVAAGGNWIAFVEGVTVKAVSRSDLRAKRDLATGVTGTAAQGLPISGGKLGVAFVQGGKVVLADPANPGRPLASEDAPQVDAVAAEEDGQGRLVWSDVAGLHVGTVAPSAARVERGMLEMGHGILAHLQGGKVAVQGGPQLEWGEIDRLQTGPAGLVAASAGRIRFRTTAGEDRVLLDRASTPVVTAGRIIYVSAGQYLSSASLTGTGATVVGVAAPGRTITNLDLLDDATLVVTVD